MATTQVEFISVDPGSVLQARKDDRRRVRIQVMRDFRRKEREREAKSKFKEKTIVPATPELVLHPPEHIRSPQLNQIALTQQLRDGWYPIGFGFSTLVPAVVRSWEPVLAVLDSMKLVHLGSCVQDEGLLIEGRKRFLVAMNCLRSNLGRDPSLALPGLMLVSIGISMTEVYNAISETATPTSWQKHIIGMSALLLKQRPIDRSSPLETFMIARLRGAQLLYSLCNREPFPKDYAAPPLVSHAPALDFVLDLAFRLPPLLASADMAAAPGVSDGPTHDRVVRDLAALEKALKSWLGSFRMSAKQTNSKDSVRQSPTQALPDMASESLCRICLLLIYQALTSLHASNKSSLSSQLHTEQLAEQCAEDLYRHTLLLSQVAERPVSKAIATRGPLHFLCWYYRSIGDSSRLERCHDIVASIRVAAPYLNWEMLLPWSLLPLTSVRGAGGPRTKHLAPPTPLDDGSNNA